MEPHRVEEELERLRPSAALGVSVHIERTAQGVSARVSRGSLERVLEAENCADLEASLVLVLSLFPTVEDPTVTPSEGVTENAVALETPAVVNEGLVSEGPAAEEADEGGTPEPNTPTSNEPTSNEPISNEPTSNEPTQNTRATSPLATWVGVGLDFDLGTLSGPSFAPSLTLSVERKRFWVAIRGVYRPSLVRQYDTGEVAMRSGQAGLSIGGYAWRGERAGLILTGGTALGLILAESRNITEPRQGRALLWAVHADAHLHWSPLPWLRVRLQAGLGIPVIRPDYQIQGLGAVYTTPRLLLRAGISLELRFWARNSS